MLLQLRHVLHSLFFRLRDTYMLLAVAVHAMLHGLSTPL
jgi:hypothetical protein